MIHATAPSTVTTSKTTVSDHVQQVSQSCSRIPHLQSLSTPYSPKLKSVSLLTSVPVGFADKKGHLIDLTTTESGLKARIHFNGGYSQNFEVVSQTNLCPVQMYDALRSGQIKAQILPSSNHIKAVCYLGPEFKLRGGAFGNTLQSGAESVLKSRLERLEHTLDKYFRQRATTEQIKSLSELYFNVGNSLSCIPFKDNIYIKQLRKYCTPKDLYLEALKHNPENYEILGSCINVLPKEGITTISGVHLSLQQIFSRAIQINPFDSRLYLALADTLHAGEILQMPGSDVTMTKINCYELALANINGRPREMELDLKKNMLHNGLHVFAADNDKSLITILDTNIKNHLIQAQDNNNRDPLIFLALARVLSAEESKVTSNHWKKKINLYLNEAFQLSEDATSKAMCWNLLGELNHEFTYIKCFDGQPINPLECFKKAIELQPEPLVASRAYALLGKYSTINYESIIVADQFEYKSRQQLFEIALQMNPANALALNQLGKHFGGTIIGQRYHNARDCYIMAITSNPDMYENYRDLGLFLNTIDIGTAHLQDGRSLDACDCRQEALNRGMPEKEWSEMANRPILRNSSCNLVTTPMISSIVRKIKTDPQNFQNYLNLIDQLQPDQGVELSNNRIITFHDCIFKASRMFQKNLTGPVGGTQETLPATSARLSHINTPVEFDTTTASAMGSAQTQLPEFGNVHQISPKVSRSLLPYENLIADLSNQNDLQEITPPQNVISSKELQQLVIENNAVIQSLIAKTPEQIPEALKSYYQSFVMAFQHIFTLSSTLATGQFKLNTKIGFGLGKSVPILNDATCDKIMGGLFTASTEAMDQASSYVPIIGGILKTIGKTGEFLHEKHQYRQLIPFAMLFGHTIQIQLKSVQIAEVLVTHPGFQQQLLKELERTKPMSSFSKAMTTLKLGHKKVEHFSRADALALKHMKGLVTGIYELSKSPKEFDTLRQAIQKSSTLAEHDLKKLLEMILQAPDTTLQNLQEQEHNMDQASDSPLSEVEIDQQTAFNGQHQIEMNRDISSKVSSLESKILRLEQSQRFRTQQDTVETHSTEDQLYLQAQASSRLNNDAHHPAVMADMRRQILELQNERMEDKSLIKTLNEQLNVLHLRLDRIEPWKL